MVYRKQQQRLLWQKDKEQNIPINMDNPCHVEIIYQNREDKPDGKFDLISFCFMSGSIKSYALPFFLILKIYKVPEEQQRLESMGGIIIPAEKNKSSRVKMITSAPGASITTAISIGMSRSIGDHPFKKVGVIATPIVGVIDIRTLVKKILGKNNKMVDDDVCIFAVSASDGMMILDDQDVLRLCSRLAFSLFEDDGPHPLSACQRLVNGAAAVWNRRNKGQFRDDITLAVTLLRSPPTPQPHLSLSPSMDKSGDGTSPTTRDIGGVNQLPVDGRRSSSTNVRRKSKPGK